MRIPMKFIRFAKDANAMVETIFKLGVRLHGVLTYHK